MNKIIFIILALIGILIAGLILAPGLVPASAYKGRIEAAATNALGREVTIGDDLSIRFVPRTAFKVNDLTIANEKGFEGGPLAQVASADIGVKLLALLSGSVEVSRFILTEPQIDLVRRADGAVNWNLASAEQASGDQASTGRDISLGDVRLVDGRATYTDETSGRRFVASDIDLGVILTSLSAPLEIDGTMTFQDQPANIELVLNDLETLMAGEPATMKLETVIGETRAGLDLELTNGETLRYTGPVTLSAPDLPAFASLTGTELADAPGFDSLSLNGDVDGGPSALDLSAAQIGFDAIEAEGALSLDWSGAKPRASGILSTEVLDLRPYMPPPPETREGFPDWSTEKLDFAALNNLNADFDISADAILLNELNIGESRLKLTIVDGRLMADIPELAMYGGQGSGRLVVNARTGVPSFAGNFDMSSVEAQPLSVDLMKHDNLLGLGGFKLDFTASGNSQAAIMSSLSGDGGFDLANGALKGVNLNALAAAAADLRQGGINPAALANVVATARGPRQETDFSEFLSQFTIANGLVNAPTISMTGPYLTMNGTGTVNLAEQTIDLRLAPRATTSADGSEGRAIAVPVRVGGTFSQPTIGVDAQALVQAGVNNALGGFLGGGASSPEEAAGNILRGVLGGRTDPAEAPTDAEANGEEETDAAASDAEEGSDAPAGEALIREGLGAIFGRKAPAEEAPQEEETPQEE